MKTNVNDPVKITVATLSDAEKYISDKIGAPYTFGMPLENFKHHYGDFNICFFESCSEGTPKSICFQVSNKAQRYCKTFIVNIRRHDCKPVDIFPSARFIGYHEMEKQQREITHLKSNSDTAAIAYLKNFLPEEFQHAEDTTDECGFPCKELIANGTKYRLWKKIESDGVTYSVKSYSDTLDRNIDIMVATA